jgi:uncharacterized protein involved in exopolysaccharide biosynthesis
VNPAIHDIREASQDSFDAQLDSPPHAYGWLLNLELFWAHRWQLVKVAACAFVISAALVLLLPKSYESTMALMPPDPMNTGSLMMAGMSSKVSPELAAMAASFLGARSNSDMFVGLLRSRTVQEATVDRLQLQRVYHSRYKQDARKSLDRHTEIEENRKNGIITLTVSDPDPQRAHNIATAYIDELNRLLSNVSTSSARRERIFIEQRLTSVKADLEDAEQQFSTFASKNTALDIKEQTRAMVDSAAMLQGELIAAQSELEGLLQLYSPGNVRVRSVQARIGELKRQLEKLGGSTNPQATDTSSTDMYPSIRKLPILGVQWADLYRRVKIQETVFELLNQQYELARIQEAKEIPTVDVIDPANLPERRSWPPRTMLVLILTTLSVMGAMAALVLQDRIHTMDPQDPRLALAQRVSTYIKRKLRSGITMVRDRT